MAKFFSLLSLAGDEGDGCVNRRREGHGRVREIKGRREGENSGKGGRKTADLYNQVCVMTPWVIFQIASNHSVLSVSHYALGIRGEELSVCIYGNNTQAEDERPILTLLGRAVSEHEAQMNSVHFFQRDCHLEDILCYYRI